MGKSVNVSAYGDDPASKTIKDRLLLESLVMLVVLLIHAKICRLCDLDGIVFLSKHMLTCLDDPK